MIWAFMLFLLKTIAIPINSPIMSQRDDDDLDIYDFSVKNINKFDINKWHFLKIFGPIVAHSWQRDHNLGKKGSL